MLVYAAAEMIALRPPSYHTIDDPPPYPDDDDDDDRPLTRDKLPAAAAPQRPQSSTRASMERPLANSSQLLHDHHWENVDQPTGDDAFHQLRDAVGRRRRADLLTCRRCMVSVCSVTRSLRQQEADAKCYRPTCKTYETVQ